MSTKAITTYEHTCDTCFLLVTADEDWDYYPGEGWAWYAIHGSNGGDDVLGLVCPRCIAKLGALYERPPLLRDEREDEKWADTHFCSACDASVEVALNEDETYTGAGWEELDNAWRELVFRDDERRSSALCGKCAAKIKPVRRIKWAEDQ